MNMDATPLPLRVAPAEEARPEGAGALRRYLRDPVAVLGLALLATALAVAAFAPWLAPADPRAMTADVLAAPGWAHPMGTDHLGRDLFSRVIWGTRVSLLFALGAAFIAFAVGTGLGALAGYFGGVLDAVLSRIIELFLMIPMLMLIILMAALLGANIYTAALVVGLTTWPPTARIARAQVLSLKQRAFVRAARAAGAGHARILMRHILPNGIQPVLINATLKVAAAVLYEASLSFLGLGDPNLPSWGQMLREAQAYLGSEWWYALFPGLAIAWLVLAVTLVGDGINRMLNDVRR